MRITEFLKGGYKDSANIKNIYKLEGFVPLGQALPFGMQHVLAMLVSNIVPIILVAGMAGLSPSLKAILIQNCMIIAGIGTLVQLYPLWRAGSGLPIVMGTSFTFVAVNGYIASKYGYGAVIGGVIAGGILEGLLGLFAGYWLKYISPVVAACVVTSIGLSLLPVGAASFAGGLGSADFASAKNMALGAITLMSLILIDVFSKGFIKRLAVLISLAIGYIAALAMGKVDFSALHGISVLSLPHIMPVIPEFRLDAVLGILLVYLVSAAETIGDTSALCNMALDRSPSHKEVSGSLVCDGFCSSLAGIFGCISITSYSQNIGLVAMTKVINRFTIATGAAVMVAAGLFPPVGALLATLPDAVLGGCTIIMFGQIVISGIYMMRKCGFTERNTLIIALSLSVGMGFTGVQGMFSMLPEIWADSLQNNCVAIVFLISLAMDILLPGKEKN
jgi:NCS2 family nucleobase:cation symporter-2